MRMIANSCMHAITQFKQDTVILRCSRDLRGLVRALLTRLDLAIPSMCKGGVNRCTIMGSPGILVATNNGALPTKDLASARQSRRPS